MPEVLPPYQFLSHFLNAAKLAKRRVYLQAMLFEAGTFLQKCEPIFIQKAREGLDVRVTFDNVAKRYVHDHPNFFIMPTKIDKHYANRVHQQTEDLIKRWNQAGVQFTITNTSKLYAHLFPIFRRNHIKIYAVDDIVWLGGINASDHALKNIDFMIPFTDSVIVKNVCKQFFRVNNSKPKKNYSIQAPPHEIVIDAGLVGRSLIYEEAIKTINLARQSIITLTPFVPDGKLLHALVQQAKHGVQINVLTQDITFPYNTQVRAFLIQTKTLKNIKLHYLKKFVHAKLIIVDDDYALFGSHNLTRIGVLLGTEEIAVKTKDKKLVQALLTFVKRTEVNH